MTQTAADAIISFLQEREGIFLPEDGRAWRDISYATGGQHTADAIAQAGRKLISEGVIEIEKPSLRKISAVMLVADVEPVPPVPPAPEPEPELEEPADEPQADEDAIARALLARVHAVLNAPAPAADHRACEKTIAQLNELLCTAEDNVIGLRAAETALRKRVISQRETIEQLSEKLRIAENNAEVWRGKALAQQQQRDDVREAATTLGNALPDHARRELEAIMKQLPRG